MSVRIIIGDALDQLRLLADESVHCCVTSPPYFGLRDYGTAQWDGGDPDCEHTGVARRCDAPGRTDKQSTQKGSSSDRVSRDCLYCGAHRIDSQIGLEPSPEEYVAALVSVFREVRRVLRRDGTLWLNIGDSYANTGNKGQDFSASLVGYGGRGRGTIGGQPVKAIPAGLKPKDLIGIPWMLAFALRADGWYLRQDIIWSKPNPMPESVTDRCTKAHEYLFLLSKSERYHYNAAAISEPFVYSGDVRVNTAYATATGQYPTRPYRHILQQDGRNKRSVWTVSSYPFPEAHFATFPPALIEPCILAGCPESGTVLDPFAGAGTTGLVADRLRRNATLIELSPAYAAMAESRIYRDGPLFADVAITHPEASYAAEWSAA